MRIPPPMKMPELFVFLRAFMYGLIAAEVYRFTNLATGRFAQLAGDWDPGWRVLGVLVVFAVCVAYVAAREGWGTTKRLVQSSRIDLLLAFALGCAAASLIAPWLGRLHALATAADPLWPVTLLALVLLVMVSALWRAYVPRRNTALPQLYFLTDDEVIAEGEDLLGANEQASKFAETVLASGSHSGLVFGVDGPWGVGKTSFLNLAQRHWEQEAADRVIVFRFEPLRYASEPDLADKFIRDLSARIQRQVFVPEFRPAASRYSRMLKGKADLSFLGLKLTLEPSAETVDELLEDIDDVLKRIQRRLIIVVDDLDRLEVKSVNTVLFTVRRTFKLTQAAYILCYDTENLVGSKEETEKAREFLEKFIHIKLSLFVDSSTLKNFLLKDWKSDESKLQSIPSDTMARLSSVLSELARILGEDKAALYIPMLGDLRKIKRFVNAVLLMQIEKTDFAKTDFNERDLINLMLLHLNFPGTFRRIYAEETEDRSGSFSVKRTHERSGAAFKNADGLAEQIEACNGRSGKFLLGELFDVGVVGLSDFRDVEESVLVSRACFNEGKHRNLERYLKLIVRFANPEPRKTFRLYQDAVHSIVKEGKSIASVLSQDVFSLDRGEDAHDQFWRIFLSQAYDVTKPVAEDAIQTMVAYLPRYSSVGREDRAMRPRSVYSLVRLLDRAGWGRTDGNRRNNTPENVVEIAHRIFGDNAYAGKSLIDQLIAPDRGVIGWSDLMLFRLQCSADRGGQNFQLQTALSFREDKNAKREGLTTLIALAGMRVLSQRIFSRFEQQYIAQQRNFLSDVDSTADEDFLGERGASILATEAGRLELADAILAAKSMNKTFVLYQLANRKPPGGSGVGCGFYDVSGIGDSGGIGVRMNEYIFGVCFNPEIDEKNLLHFADYCLCNLTSAYFTGEEEGYVPTAAGLADELDAVALGQFWANHRDRVLQADFTSMDRRVVTMNYVATYKEDLPKVLRVLDGMLFVGPPRPPQQSGA
jgi:hypothetical protein